MFASFKILSGVFIIKSNGFFNINAIAVIIIVKIAVNFILLATAFFTPSSSFAPNFWETNMEKPLVNPIIIPFTKKNIEPVEPTAANASTPTNLPTIIVSTILYNCWNMFPISSGIENSTKIFKGLPFVISFVIIHL